MKELPAGVVRGTHVLLLIHPDSQVVHLFQMLQKQYWKEAQLSGHQQPGTCTTCGEVQQFCAWEEASHRDCSLVHVDLWYLGMDHMLLLVLCRSSVE